MQDNTQKESAPSMWKALIYFNSSVNIGAYRVIMLKQ